MYDHKKLSKDFDEKEALDEMWQTVAAKPALMTRGKYGSQLLEGPEIELLKGVRDPASVIWTWNAAIIGRLAQDGWIPPMPSPTYGRIMTLCQGAHQGIRQVRASICVQTPWNYTHCLASLVHINNAINAVNLGLVSGLVTATLLQRHNVLHYHFKASLEQVEEDIANCLVTVLLCTIGPAVYQARLLISIALAQPFDDDDAKIPMKRLLNQLEVDMCDSLELILAAGNHDLNPKSSKLYWRLPQNRSTTHVKTQHISKHQMHSELQVFREIQQKTTSIQREPS